MVSVVSTGEDGEAGGEAWVLIGTGTTLVDPAAEVEVEADDDESRGVGIIWELLATDATGVKADDWLVLSRELRLELVETIVVVSVDT